MFNLCQLPSQCAEIFMDNSMIFFNCSEQVTMSPIQAAKSNKLAMSLLVISSIEDITLLKLFNSYSASKLNILIESLSSVEIMNLGKSVFILDKLQQSMDFMMKSTKNMEIQIHGNIAQMCLIIYLLELLSMVIYFVCMVDLVPRSKQLIKFVPLIGRCKFHMKDHFLILYGQIHRILRIGL